MPADAHFISARPSHSVNVQSIGVHPAMGNFCVALRPCPLLSPEETLGFGVSAQVNAAIADSTGLVASINLCDQDGVIPQGGGNIAFLTHDLTMAVGDQPHAWNWVYDPRLGHVPPDIDLGDGSGRFLGLHFAAIGDWVVINSVCFKVEQGGATTTIDETSANLRDGKGFATGF